MVNQRDHDQLECPVCLGDCLSGRSGDTAALDNTMSDLRGSTFCLVNKFASDGKVEPLLTVIRNQYFYKFNRGNWAKIGGQVNLV